MRVLSKVVTFFTVNWELVTVRFQVLLISRAIISVDALNRAGAFLVVVCTVHMLGNLTVFGGAKMFNAYGDALSRNPAIKFIEYYLLAASLVHAGTASYFSYNKRRMLAKQPVARHSILLISSLFVVLFVVLHLLHNRLAEMFQLLNLQQLK